MSSYRQEENRVKKAFIKDVNKYIKKYSKLPKSEVSNIAFEKRGKTLLLKKPLGIVSISKKNADSIEDDIENSMNLFFYFDKDMNVSKETKDYIKELMPDATKKQREGLQDILQMYFEPRLLYKKYMDY